MYYYKVLELFLLKGYNLPLYKHSEGEKRESPQKGL